MLKKEGKRLEVGATPGLLEGEAGRRKEVWGLLLRLKEGCSY